MRLGCRMQMDNGRRGQGRRCIVYIDASTVLYSINFTPPNSWAAKQSSSRAHLFSDEFGVCHTIFAFGHFRFGTDCERLTNVHRFHFVFIFWNIIIILFEPYRPYMATSICDDRCNAQIFFGEIEPTYSDRNGFTYTTHTQHWRTHLEWGNV